MPFHGGIVSTNGFVQKKQIASAPILLFSIQGYHQGAAVQWLQIHNSADPPTNGSTPVHTFAIDAQNNFNVNVPATGMPLGPNVTVALSSTAGTYAAGAADVFFTATMQGL